MIRSLRLFRLSPGFVEAGRIKMIFIGSFSSSGIVSARGAFANEEISGVRRCGRWLPA
jgi:hypothetical protein